jgi:hypothetical protein
MKLEIPEKVAVARLWTMADFHPSCAIHFPGFSFVDGPTAKPV